MSFRGAFEVSDIIAVLNADSKTARAQRATPRTGTEQSKRGLGYNIPQQPGSHEKVVRLDVRRLLCRSLETLIPKPL